MGYRNYSITNGFVVDKAGNGDFTTITTALAAATSGTRIDINPGTYTENFTLPVGVTLNAVGSSGTTPSVTIVGKITMTAGGTSTISGIQLQTNSDYFLVVSGSAASVVYLDNCWLECLNHTGISYTSSSSSSLIYAKNCLGDIGTTGITLFSSSGSGGIDFSLCDFTNTGASTTASTISAGQLSVEYTFFNHPITTSSTAILAASYTSFATATNTTCLTHGGATTSNVNNCQFGSGSASAVSVSTTLNMYTSEVNSSNTHAITGSGTVNWNLTTYTSSSSLNNATTQTSMFTDLGKWKATNQPQFFAYLSSNKSDVTGDGTNYTIPFDTATINVGTCYNTSTGTFTAPQTGMYLISSSVYFSGVVAATGTISLIGYIGSAYSLRQNQICTTFTNDLSIPTAQLIHMTAGDTMTITGSIIGSSKVVSIAGAALSGPFAETSTFSAILLA
jgi:hypothetical protein